MDEILNYVERQLGEGTSVTIQVPDPDLSLGSYAGSLIEVEGLYCVGRSLHAWVNLAELLYCRLATPVRLGDGWVSLTFDPLSRIETFHRTSEDPRERYGRESRFYAINKGEEPTFLFWYKHALARVGAEKKRRILDLGVNRGDELAILLSMRGESEKSEGVEIVGVDHSWSAMEHARERFPGEEFSFHTEDINKLDDLNLGRFDLIVSIGTFQSPSLQFKPLLMKLVKEYLTPDGALVLGFPNCRWIDGQMVYGAKAPNNSYPEKSLLLNDVGFCRRYLQQHRFRVTVTGKEYIFVAATPLMKLKKAHLKRELEHPALERSALIAVVPTLVAFN